MSSIKIKQEMTDEKFIKQAKQKIIEKEFEHNCTYFYKLI